MFNFQLCDSVAPGRGRDNFKYMCIGISFLLAYHVSQEKWFILDVALLQVIGIRGNNLSGHCLIVSEIIDHVSLSDFSNKSSQPAKKQALN